MSAPVRHAGAGRRPSRPAALVAVIAVLLLARGAPAAGPDAGSAGAGVADRPLLGRAPALAGDEVLVSAERLERRGNERVVAGEGSVVVRHRDLRLVADRAVYNESTQDIVADGNVVLDSGPDRLQGEHLELNLGTRVGFMQEAQGFVQTYYFTGSRIEKQGPDHYVVRGGSFTTCEGVLPDWSFHATTADVTVDEYLHAWNPTLHVKRLPVLYIPYAVFPVKRDRSTGLLIPAVAYTERDGFVLRNAFYWAPRDNFDATLGLDYLQKTGWGASGEVRYLLAPRTQGIVSGEYVQEESGTGGTSERWAIDTRNSHELPLGVQLEAEAFVQSDRRFVATYGRTIERRSSERTTASVYLNRNWSAWDFTLSGRHEESLITEKRNTLTRLPELTVDRTSTRLFDTDLLLRLDASAARLRKETASAQFETTRLHLAPELTWPLSLGSVARILPTAAYDLTSYSEDANGDKATRRVPSYRLTLEGPRLYRTWELAGGSFEKLKHLVEPSIGYIHVADVGQESVPQFDAIDRIEAANRLEYSLTNTLYAKVLHKRASPAALPGASAATAQGEPAAPEAEPPLSTTRELLWVKLSQTYSLKEEEGEARQFSPVEWDARTAPGGGLDLTWRGNFDVYGKGIGYQDLSVSWAPTPGAVIRGEWRTTRDSVQDFLDVGGELTLGRIGLEGRSRYSLAEDTFVENRVSVKYSSQCWDLTLGYVDWTDMYEYSLLISLKGIGTILKI